MSLIELHRVSMLPTKLRNAGCWIL